MKELLKDLGFEHLPMLSEFVRKVTNTEHISDKGARHYTTWRIEHIDNYANLITQPLTKGMFVPCDEEGNVLVNPNELEGKRRAYLWELLKKQYQQAQDRVLFEGCTDVTEREVFIGDEIIFLKKYKTIEDAINNGVKLKLIQ